VVPLAPIPGVRVLTGWDIGVGDKDQTAIWFAQVVGDDIRLIDYYENTGEGFDHYFKYVMEKPYVYERMFLPHDSEKTDWGTGKSTIEYVIKAFGQYNVPVTVIDKLSIKEGIEVTRRLFPRFRIDAEKCGKRKYRGHTALDCIASYHKKWNEDKLEFDDKPHHNWASHCADALRYLCLGLKDVAPKKVSGVYKSSHNPLFDVSAEYEADDDPLERNYAAF
jgi:hypothetical protein